MSSEQLILLFGFAIMAIGSLTIFAHGDKRREYRHHTQFHSVVPFIAATAYLAMFLGTGVIEAGGSTLYLPRYLDWSVTTPILLAGLILTGLHEHPRHSTYILPAIVLDVIMIVTGLAAALTDDPTQKLIWFAWSCAAFAGVLYILWKPVRDVAADLGGGMETVYRRNLTFLTAVWLIYPLAFAAGPEWLGVIGGTGSLLLILVLDVTAKVIYGFVATSRFKKLPDGTDGQTRRYG